MSTSRPELAVIVLSCRNERTILAALDSLLDQDPPLEIVVSHSCGGPTPELLARERPGVRVLASAERRLPGAARNVGVAATRAPYVAFLAGDCRARPGWAAGRLERHRAGAVAVSSALAPADGGRASVASYLAQHSWRMPHLERPGALFAWLHRHPPPPVAGVSYARWVLERYGPFPERLVFGEDSALNERLGGAGIEFAWAPEVVTEHVFPTTTGGMLFDQYRRGRSRGALYGRWLWRVGIAARTAIEPAIALSRASRRGSPVPRRRLPAVAPLVLAGAGAAAAGALRAGRPLDPVALRYGTQRRRRLVERWFEEPGEIEPAELAVDRGSHETPGNGSPPPDMLEHAILAIHDRRVIIPSGAPWLGPRRRVRLLALLAARDEAEQLPAWLRNVAPQVDGIVALDDGSRDGTGDWLSSRPEILEVIRVPVDRPRWDEVANHRALVAAAHRHGAEWVICVDADERVERDFRIRAETVIGRGRLLGLSAYRVRLRELWDLPRQYRVDGIWGRKLIARLFRVRADHRFDTRPLHSVKAPLQASRNGTFPIADLEIYHLRMIQREDRIARRLRYESADPEALFQPVGYAYLTDEGNIRLKQVPPDRDYLD